MHRRTVLMPAALVALGLLPALARGDDAPLAPAAEGAAAKPVETAKKPAPAAPKIDDVKKGDRARAKLRSEGTAEGVVLVDGLWERRDVVQGWVSAKKDEAGAGVRLWYVGELDGYQFVPYREIAELRSLGALTAEEQQAIEKRRADSARRAEEERRRLAADKAYSADAAEKAKALVAEVEKAQAEAQAKAAVEAAKGLDAARTKRWAELLAKFPPDRWSVDTPKEIERRKLVLHLFPSDEELDFLKVYDEWREAYLGWKAAAEAQKQPARK